MKPKHPLFTAFYVSSLSIAAVMIFYLRWIPLITQGLAGLMTIWAFGYGLTDAGILSAYTVFKFARRATA